MKLVTQYLSLSFKFIKEKADYFFLGVIGLISSIPILKTFFYADDFHHLFINNEKFTKFGWNVFSLDAQVYTNNNLYRPTTNLYYIIMQKLGGVEAFWFHLVQLIFFIATALLVRYLVLKIINNRIVANVSALLFILFPARVEPSQWPANICDTFMVFFVVLTFIFFIKAIDTEKINKKFLLFSGFGILSFGVALLSKEPAVSLVPVLILFVLSLKKVNIKSSLALVLFSIPVIPYSIMRLIYNARSKAAPSYHMPALDSSNLDAYILNAKSFMLRSFGLPYNPMEIKFLKVFAIAAVVVLLIAVFIYFSSKAKGKDLRLYIFLLAFYALAVLPTISVPNYFDRYLYLGSIPLVILFALIILGLYNLTKSKAVYIVSVLLVSSFFGAQTLSKIKIEYEGSMITKNFMESLEPLKNEKEALLLNVPFYYDKVSLGIWPERTLAVNQTRYIFNLFHGTDVKTKDIVISIFYDKEPSFLYQKTDKGIKFDVTGQGLAINPIHPKAGEIIPIEYKLPAGVVGELILNDPGIYWLYKNGKQEKVMVGK